jgi:hypothetical protein
MELLHSGVQGNESAFLRDLFIRALPSRANRIITGQSTEPAKEAVAILAFFAAVGLGYLYGPMKRDVLREEVDDSTRNDIDDTDSMALDK